MADVQICNSENFTGSQLGNIITAVTNIEFCTYCATHS